MSRTKWYGWGTGIALAGSLLSTPVAAQPCPPFINQILPVSLPGKVIVLGKIQGKHHVVVVPANRPNTLDAVRQCIPNAFLTSSRLGNYVHAGAFADYNQAASLAWMLRSRGLDARVVYSP